MLTFQPDKRFTITLERIELPRFLQKGCEDRVYLAEPLPDGKYRLYSCSISDRVYDADIVEEVARIIEVNVQALHKEINQDVDSKRNQ